jgi:hypothetical protein
MRLASHLEEIGLVVGVSGGGEDDDVDGAWRPGGRGRPVPSDISA